MNSCKLDNELPLIGIIGGLGPDTTADFYTEFIHRVDALQGQSRPGVMICGVPINYQIERDAIVQGKNVELIAPILIDAAKRLVASGATVLAMPCNSLHIFIDQIRAAVPVPVISIVEEVLKRGESLKIKKVALLGTKLTINNGPYRSAFESIGVQCLVPTDTEEALFGKTIHSLVMGTASPKNLRQLENVAKSMLDRGATHIVLACTDLKVLTEGLKTSSVIDTYDVLINSLVDLISSKLERDPIMHLAVR